MKRLLYINDYASSPEYILECKNGHYPKSHLWGIYEFIQKNQAINILWCNPNDYRYESKRIYKTGIISKLIHLYQVFSIFLRYWKCDVIYSALPTYEWCFLLAKKLRLKRYRIITVVHHPNSRLLLKSAYDKMIFISKVAYDRYAELPNAEYLFWGPDLDFYDRIDRDKKYDFVAAGKTYRDYELFRAALKGQTDKIVIYGENDSNKNEITYSDLLNEYQKAKFIAIPMVRLKEENSTLIGLTSFVDALGMGIPVLMSDNSLIGIDINALGIGVEYKAGNEADLSSSISKCLKMDSIEYEQMSRNCLAFAKEYDFKKFSIRINELLK